MTFHDCLAEQCKLHPSMQCVDVVKLCYQAAFGAEHLLTDVATAKVYFEDEYASVAQKVSLQKSLSFKDKMDFYGNSCINIANIPLIEYISSDVVRVNFVPWIAAGKDKDALFDMFVKSASVPHGGEAVFRKYIDVATDLINKKPGVQKNKLDNHIVKGINTETWVQFINDYFAKGIHAVHHSEVYEKVEHPAYRIVCDLYSK
jgi:hypothetical protein